MKRICKIKLAQFSIAVALISFSTLTAASDFNIPFVNAADLGDLYSGWAAAGNDASTAYTNPAGLIRITNQQLVVAALGINGNTEFHGTTTPPFPPFAPQTGIASSDLSGFLPSFYYAAPINDKVVFGFGETIPFGLGTNYAPDSIVRYAATRSQIAVVDIGPSVGVKITDKLSAGLGLDFDRITFTLNSMIGPPFSVPDSASQNHLAGWGYGWHGGLLYQFTPATRVGVDYNSHVVFHTTGDSEIFGPPAIGIFRTTNQKSNVTLPELVQASVYHDLNQRWTVMGTVFYSNWSILNQLTLKNTMLPGGATTSVTVPFNYHNTFDYAAGLSFKATEKWLLRTGVELLQTPTNNQNRIIGDPLGAATIVSIGAHFQQNHALGYDVGYAHAFFDQTAFNYISPIATVTGHSDSYNNIFGAQITWNIT